MEVIANNLFNDRDDNGDLLGRCRLLWMHHGTHLTRFTPRRPPTEMLLEATRRTPRAVLRLGMPRPGMAVTVGLDEDTEPAALSRGQTGAVLE